MATIDTASPLPLNEIANRIAADGGIPEIFWGLMKKNQLLEKLKFMPSSHETHHEFIKTLSRPSGTWTHVNVGVPAHSTRTAPVKEYMGRLEDRNEIDVRAFEGLSKAAAANVRLIEDKQFMIGLGTTVSKAAIYESQGIEPDAFDGFFSRAAYASVAGGQVINAGGSTALGSILVMELSPETIYGIYPKGTKVGLQIEDKGEERTVDALGNPFYVKASHFTWRIGLTIKDETGLVRIANIADAKDNDGATLFGPHEDQIIDAFAMLPNMGKENTYVAMNRRQLKNFQKALKDRINVHYTPDNPFGRLWMSEILGAEIIMQEELMNTESAIS